MHTIHIHIIHTHTNIATYLYPPIYLMHALFFVSHHLFLLVLFAIIKRIIVKYVRIITHLYLTVLFLFFRRRKKSIKGKLNFLFFLACKFFHLCYSHRCTLRHYSSLSRDNERILIHFLLLLLLRYHLLFGCSDIRTNFFPFFFHFFDIYA